jgi:hypothetical protein
MRRAKRSLARGRNRGSSGIDLFRVSTPSAVTSSESSWPTTMIARTIAESSRIGDESRTNDWSILSR